MKVYRIKRVEQEEIDCGLMGTDWQTYESLLDEVYISEKAALNHMPENVDESYHKITYSVIVQETINK
jgi:hypothetical protein